jgi:DNA invertase Pin-like site-specific DNA recombinase
MDLERELMDLRAWCGQNRHQVVAQYVDDDRDGSGRRPARARLMKDAARQQFDMVLVTSLDRFDVKGVGETALDIQRLLRHGVAFRSFTEDHLSTDDPQMQPVLLPVILSFAGLEEKKVSKRIKAGMRRARAKGKRFGRPSFSVEQRKKLQTALNAGANWLKVSRRTGIPYSTVKKYARQMGYEPPEWVPY